MRVGIFFAAVVLLALLAHAAAVMNHFALLHSFTSDDLSQKLRALNEGERVDVIVHLKEMVDIADITQQVQQKSASTFKTMTASAKSDFVAREMVHQLQVTAELTQHAMLKYLRTSNAAAAVEEVKPLWIINAISLRRASVDLLADLALRYGQDIEVMEHNEKVSIVPPVKTGMRPTRAHRHGNDIIEENLEYIQATDMWRLGYEGQGMTVAVVDTGVDAIAHPALKEKYRGKNGDHDYNWYDPYKGSKEPHDSDKHGTHCTGIVLGSLGDELTKQEHYYGVAPKADYIACLGLNRGSGYVDKLVSCWQFVLAPTDTEGNNPDPSRRAHITSNSWGGRYTSAKLAYKRAADAIRAAGIFNSVAAGNSGRSGCATLGAPGVFDNLFTVCAMDHRDGNVTDFSSRGPIPNVLGKYMKPDACGPGQAILSSIPGGQYASFSGTSMATPHIAGAVALLWEAVPELARDVEKTERLLRLSSLEKVDLQCSPNQPIPNYVYGHGNVKILDAFKMAKGRKL